jgi:hypothetical protein
MVTLMRPFASVRFADRIEAGEGSSEGDGCAFAAATWSGDRLETSSNGLPSGELLAEGFACSVGIGTV